MAPEHAGQTESVEEAAERRTMTVIGLFEDPLDLREALEGLRKQGDATTVSLIIRDHLVDDESTAERHGAVARSADVADIGRSATWLTRLASIIVPERGGFLVAGPIGLALTGGIGAPDKSSDEAPSAIATMLRGFGFSDDETTYIEHRLVAGTLLTGVTSDADEACSAARTLFAEGNAVYLASGVASADALDALAAMHESVPSILADGDVVVTDAVGHLHGICRLNGGRGSLVDLCGRVVVDRDGVEVGEIDEILVESVTTPDAAAEGLKPRYVVVSFGGILGFGRRRAAVPTEQVKPEGEVVRLAFDRATLERAPSWNAHAPFSRREERLVCAYFGTPPYWTDES